MISERDDQVIVKMADNAVEKTDKEEGDTDDDDDEDDDDDDEEEDTIDDNSKSSDEKQCPSCRITLPFSTPQNRTEYDKRVLAQARAMST